MCAEDLIALKNPSPWPGLNPQSLGPVASTLTTTPPRRPAVYYFRAVSKTMFVAYRKPSPHHASGFRPNNNMCLFSSYFNLFNWPSAAGLRVNVRSQN
jgi:hypothetical protein